MPEWDEQGNPIQEWDEQGNPAAGLRGAEIKPQPSLLSRVGTQIKGFGQELPLMASRGVSLLQDVAQGQQPWDPTVAAERAARERKINEMLGASELSGQPEQRVGRIAARMVPGIATAVATGGMSLPAQAAIQGGVQGLQSLSEGASPGETAFGTALAAGAPFAAGGVNRLFSMLKAPFAGSVDQGIIKAAERQGVQLPASAVTNSSVSRGMEQMASRMLGGGDIEKRGLSAIEDIGEKAGSMSAGANPTAAGEAVAGDYATRRGALQATKNAEYGKIGSLTGIEAAPEQTLAQIDSLLAQGTLDPDTLANLRKLREAISPKPVELPPEVQKALDQYAGDPKMREVILKQFKMEDVPPQPRSVADLMSQQSGIEYGGPNAMRDAALGNRLRSNLGEDIGSSLERAAPEKAAQLGVAKKAYGEYADLSQSQLGKTVSSNVERGTVDKIPETLLRSSSSRADLQRLMDVAEPGTKEELQRVMLKQIVGDGKNLTPKAIERALKSYKNADVILEPDQLARLRDLSTLREAMAKTTIGSPTTPLLQARKYLETPARAMLAGSLSGLAGVGVELGSEAAIAKFLGSTAGQRWLTTGFAPAKLPGRLAQAPITAASRLPAELSLDRQRRRSELDALLAPVQP